MSNTIEGFGKRIGDLIGSVTTLEDDASFLNTLANKVILNVNVFCPLVNGCIMGKVFSSIIVNSDLYWLFGVGRIEDGAKFCEPY